MAEQYPDTEITVTNLNGSISNLQNNNTTDWYTTPDPDSNTELHVGMQDPSNDLDGNQPVDFYVRATANGNNDPDVDLYLYEGGSQVLQFGTTIVTSTSGQTISHSFSDTDVSSGAAVEMDCIGNRTGGMAGTRDTVEYGYITWDAAILQEVSTTTEQPRNVDTSSATLVADATVEGYDNADVWFTWGEVGNNMPNTTTTYTISSSQEVTHDLTGLAESTEYEYQAHIDHTDTTSDSGSIVSFWTHYPVAGTVTYASDGTDVENATVHIVDTNTGEGLEMLSTDATGDYSTTVPGNHEVHVVARHEDADGNQYNAPSHHSIN